MELALTLEDGTVTRVVNAKGLQSYVPPIIPTVKLLDVANFGAVADNKGAAATNVTAFNRAFAEAKATKSHVIVRRAYWLNQIVRADSITLHVEGALWFTDGTSATNCSLFLRGNAPKLNLTGSINSDATTRGGGAWGQHLVQVVANDFEVYGGGTLSGAACTGVFVAMSQRGAVRDISVRNTKADSFHITNGSSYITFDRCSTTNGGDDMFAVVSYNGDSNGIVHDITCRNFVGNTNTRNGRGMTVVGGHNILYEDSKVSNVWGFGLYISSEQSYNTHGVRNVTLRRVAVDGCGVFGPDLGDGLRVFGRAGLDPLGFVQTVDGLVLENVTVNRPKRNGALISTTHVKNLTRGNFAATNLTAGAVWAQIA